MRGGGGATAPSYILAVGELFLSISSFSLFPLFVCLLVSFGAAEFGFYLFGFEEPTSASPPTPGSSGIVIGSSSFFVFFKNRGACGVWLM